MSETTYEEMQALKEEIDNSIVELKKATKTSAVSIAIRAIVAASASSIISKITDAFLPKQLKAPVKMAIAVGTFMVPELIANAAGSYTEKIMEEE